MSRAHAVAPLADRGASYSGPTQSAGPARAAVARRERTVSGDYVERAMLLWPRLDRGSVRRVADDPARLADLIERRTSQPHDVIVAMLTRETERLAVSADRPATTRPALRVVSTDSGAQGTVDLRPV